MDRDSWVAGYRVGFALLAFVALGYQFFDGRGTNPDFRAINFFSFFTVQSNIFAALVLLVAVWFTINGRRLGRFELVRGAAVLYMATTGVVYGLLLSGYQEALQTALPWVNTVVHRVMPLVLVADWLIDPPARSINLREAALWLIYPLAFVAFTLIRGPGAEWYPYPFLDPDEAGGYLIVTLYCVGIAVGMMLSAWVVVAVARRRARPGRGLR